MIEEVDTACHGDSGVNRQVLNVATGTWVYVSGTKVDNPVQMNGLEAMIDETEHAKRRANCSSCVAGSEKFYLAIEPFLTSKLLLPRHSAQFYLQIITMTAS